MARVVRLFLNQNLRGRAASCHAVFFFRHEAKARPKHVMLQLKFKLNTKYNTFFEISTHPFFENINAGDLKLEPQDSQQPESQPKQDENSSDSERTLSLPGWD